MPNTEEETLLGVSSDEEDEVDSYEEDPAEHTSLHTYSIHVGKDNLSSAIAAAFRLQNVATLDHHNIVGFVIALLIQLLCMFTQIVIIRIFVVHTENGMWATIAATRKVLDQHHTTGVKDISAIVTACASQSIPPFVGQLFLFVWYAFIGEYISAAGSHLAMVAFWPFTQKGVDAATEKDKHVAIFHEQTTEDKDLDHYDVDHDSMGRDKDHIGYMTLPLKIFALFCIVLPQMVLVLYIAWAGMKFLVPTGFVGGLLLKTISLKFVLSLDKVFYKNFLPPLFLKYLSTAKFVLISRPERSYTKTWLLSVVKVALVSIAVALTWRHYSFVLDMRRECTGYISLWGKKEHQF